MKKKPTATPPARPVSTSLKLDREDHARLGDLCAHERIRSGSELLRLLIRRAHAALPPSARTR